MAVVDKAVANLVNEFGWRAFADAYERARQEQLAGNESCPSCLRNFKEHGLSRGRLLLPGSPWRCGGDDVEECRRLLLARSSEGVVINEH